MKRINLNKIVMLLVLLFTMNANAQVSFYVNEITFDEGSLEQKVAICMQNEPSNITGIQFDIYLSEGLSVKSGKWGYTFEFSDRGSTISHTLQSALQNDGSVRVISASSNHYSYDGNDGALIYFTLVASSDFKGLGKIELKNCVATGADSDGSNIVQYKPADFSATVMDYATGIDEIATDDATAEYYTLQGVKIEKENLSQGVYVKKVGNKSSKVVVK